MRKQLQPLVQSMVPPQFEDLRGLVDDAFKVDLTGFVQLIENVADLLKKERGQVGNMEITGKLIEAPPLGETIVIGDLHGDLESLVNILRTSSFLEKIQRGEKPLLLFLGDYGDRGVLSSEVYYVVLSLKERFRESVVLMRGNHEGPDDLLASPHDLPDYLNSRFGADWSIAYAKLKELFGQLYNGVVVRDRCVFLHGGVPSQAKSLDDVAYAHLKHPKESHLEEILWSDPEEGIKGTLPSPRGAGRLFGPDVTARFLQMLNVNVLVRGHESADMGYKINHGGRVLTLFSRKGEPYFNSQGGFLQFNLATSVRDAYQLQRFASTF